MDVMREWLAPTMIREIGAMMQSRTGASDWSNPIDGNPYSDDGSSLRARSFRSGVVQITKLYATDGPIKVVISDSYTMVRATIASSAATRYGPTTKRRITKDTLGGLIQILDFEIVATHLGSRSERATIFINDFKSIGSEGSGAFGCPRPLESLSEVVELLDQLKELRARESQGSQPRSRLGSITDGSPINSPLAADSPKATQTMFATQVPSHYSERPLRADSGVQQEGVTKSIGNKLEDVINHNHDTAARQIEDRPSVKAKAKTMGKRNVNNSDALLSLLAPKRTATYPDSNLITETQRDVTQSPKPGEKSPDPGLDIRNLSVAKANNQSTAWPTATNTPMNIHADGQELENALNRTPAVQPSSEFDISSRHTPRDSPLVHVGNPSQEFPNSSHSGGAVDYNTVAETGKASKVQEGCVLILIHNQPFKRICTSDTRIPNDQQKLLDRADSWLPAEPGQRGPVANVPIATLQTFDHRAELAARQSLPSPARQHQKEEGADDVTTSLASQPSPRLKDAGNDDSDPEIPLSSSEWPLSPPLEQPTDELPPDSSMESIGRLSTVSGKDSNHSPYNSQIPPPFETSLSSAATRSSQRKAKRTSKALQIAGRSSPSLVSGSADEDGKRFRCQEFGCHKAYVGPSGLRYHMEHGHNSSQHKGSPSRPRVPKSKNRGKYPPTIYICTRCYNHFDSEAEIAHHENLNSCSPPQNTLPKEPELAKVDVGQSFTNIENSSTTPLQNDKVVDLREGNQKDGPSSVVWRLGESTPISPRPTYVSSYASPRQAERLTTSSMSSPKSISGRHVESTPNLSRSTPPPHEARVSQPDGKWSKGARSDVSNVESELETTIPHALNEATGLHVTSPPVHQFPSTEPHSEEPFTQVKRTPYVNGCFNGNIHSHPGLHALPVNGKMSDLPFIASTKQIDRGLTPHGSTPPITTVQHPQENVGEGHPMHDIEDQVTVDQAVMAPQFHPEIAAQSSTSRSVSPTRKRNLFHLESMMLRSTSVSTSSESTLHRDDLSVTGTRSDSGLKRNAFEPMPLSPHVAKRRKRTKAPAAFKFSQDAPVAQDPSILARAYRQEFLASRKSSASEQSDVSRGATGLTENSSDPIVQQNHPIDVVQDGNPGSEIEADKPPADTNPSHSVNSSVEKIPLAISKANNQLTTSGNNEDVVMATENQDNLIDPVNSSSVLQGRDPSSIVNGLLVNQYHTNKDIEHPEPQKYLGLVLAHDLVSTNAKDLDASKTNKLAPSQLGADKQEGRTEFESVSTVRTFGESNETDSNVAPFAQEDVQGFSNPVNAYLSSGQESDLITSGESFEKFPTQAPEIAKRSPSPTQALIQPPEVAENGKAPAQADVLMTDANPRSSIQIFEAPSSQDKSADQSPHTTPVTVFETFKVSYPEYKGNEQHFVAICKKIDALVQQDRMEHRSLWDDFIIRHTMEYTQYLQTCALNAEDPLPYERFYRNEIEDPRFTKRIVTPKNLKEVLGIGGQEDSMVLPQQQQQQQHHPTQQPLTQQFPNQQRLFQRPFPYQPLNADLQDGSPIPAFKSSPKPTSVNAGISKPPVPQPTVDLTNASDEEEPRQSMKRTRRSLPWEKSSQDVAPSPSPLRVPNLGNATSGHSLATPIKSTIKVPTSPNMSMPAGSSSKRDISCSSPISPLPRTSSKLKPEFIRKTNQDGQRASTLSSKGASVFKPLPSDTGQASQDIRKSFSKSITVNNEQQPVFAENPHHTQDETKKVSWKDPDNPFKQFAKAYTAIKPARGNAFAMEQAKAVAAAKEKAKAKAKARDEVKQIVKEMEKANEEEKRGEEKTPTRSPDSSRGPRTRKPKRSNLNILDWHL